MQFLEEKYQIFDNALLLEKTETNENEYGLENSIQKLKNSIPNFDDKYSEYQNKYALNIVSNFEFNRIDVDDVMCPYCNTTFKPFSISKHINSKNHELNFNRPKKRNMIKTAWDKAFMEVFGNDL